MSCREGRSGVCSLGARCFPLLLGAIAWAGNNPIARRNSGRPERSLAVSSCLVQTNWPEYQAERAGAILDGEGDARQQKPLAGLHAGIYLRASSRVSLMKARNFS